MPRVGFGRPDWYVLANALEIALWAIQTIVVEGIDALLARLLAWPGLGW
jgi:hypothetical protein